VLRNDRLSGPVEVGGCNKGWSPYSTEKSEILRFWRSPAAFKNRVLWVFLGASEALLGREAGASEALVVSRISEERGSEASEALLGCFFL
jgi:hypothetical protein